MAITSPRAGSVSFPKAPIHWGRNVEEWVRLVAQAVNRIDDGSINATGTITLTISVASTTLSDRRIGQQTKVILVPTTANAAGELATLYQTLPNATEGQAVLNHANNAQADRTFGYVLAG